MEKIQSSHLYQYIQAFLKNHEYLRLMNTNQEMFQEIKRETFIYHVVINNSNEPLKLRLLPKLMERVANPNKQINLYLFGIVTKFVNVLQLAPRLHYLTIDTEFRRYSDEFDFSIFNNIPCVCLVGFSGIRKISSGLENIEELTLTIETLEEIYDFNTSGTLRKLVCIHCPNLIRFPIQREQSTVQDIFMFPLMKRKRIIFANPITTTSIDMNSLFIKNIHLLQLSISTQNVHSIDFTIFQNIPVLQLEYRRQPPSSSSSSSSSSFPSVFNGNELSLRGFSLETWSTPHTEFPHIRKLNLINCRDLFQLPRMPEIKEIDLQEIKDLAQISLSFEQLTFLHLEEISSLEKIVYQPRLKYLQLIECNQISDLSSLEGIIFREVKVSKCSGIIDISSLRHSYSLEIQHCPHLMTWKFYKSSISSRIRSLTIGNMTRHPLNPLDFPAYQDLYRLSLINMPSCKDIVIRNIHHVEISSCQDYTSTKNLMNIHESLILSHCPIKSLCSLQNIPKIFLCSLLETPFDISGLGYHDHLYISGVPYLADLAEKYVEDIRANRAQEHPYHRIFRTIRSCTIVGSKEYGLVSFFGWNSLNFFQQTRLW